MVEGKLGSLALGILYGSLERVYDIRGSLFVNINGDGAAVLGLDGLNAVCRTGGDVCGPLNGVGHAVYADHANAGVVGSGDFSLVAVHRVDVLLGKRKGVLFGLPGLAGGKRRYAKGKQNNY